MFAAYMTAELIFYLLLPIASCIFLYRLLIHRVHTNKLSPLKARLFLAIVMFILPWVIAIFSSILFSFLKPLMNLPGGWDNSQALSSAISFLLSYFVSIISILIGCFKLVRKSRS